MNATLRFTVVLCAAGAALAALSCSLHPTRVVTVPPGATLYHEGRHMELITPCDFTGDFDLDDQVVISKEGYRPFRGTLRELRQIADGVYQLELEPLP
jgi:hypothetical protein